MRRRVTRRLTGLQTICKCNKIAKVCLKRSIISDPVRSGCQFSKLQYCGYSKCSVTVLVVQKSELPRVPFGKTFPSTTEAARAFGSLCKTETQRLCQSTHGSTCFFLQIRRRLTRIQGQITATTSIRQRVSGPPEICERWRATSDSSECDETCHAYVRWLIQYVLLR